MTTLDAQCIQRAIDECIPHEYEGPPLLPNQTVPTVDYHDSTPCLGGKTYGPDGQFLSACDYNPAVHHNPARLIACEARVRASPPPECRVQVFTASGWTRQYSIHTVSPITRLKRDKPIQTGKVLVTCVVSIPGIGSHSGSGEEWADDENAMTSAEAQAGEDETFMDARCEGHSGHMTGRALDQQ